MSLDQNVACRRMPKLPDDLPDAARWARSMFEDKPVFTRDGQRWLVHVKAENGYPEDMTEQLVEVLADAGITDARPSDFGVMVYVTVEPASAPEDALDIQTAILDMLVETCDGVVLAN
jgi:hypothetical protein